MTEDGPAPPALGVNENVAETQVRPATRSDAATLKVTLVTAPPIAGTGTPKIVSRTVATPEVTDNVLKVAVDAAAPDDGFVSPVTGHTNKSLANLEAFLSVISRPLAAENVVVATGSFEPTLEQVAAGDDPVNVGKPVMEIKLTLLASNPDPANLTVKVTAADTLLLLNAIEAV